MRKALESKTGAMLVLTSIVPHCSAVEADEAVSLSTLVQTHQSSNYIQIRKRSDSVISYRQSNLKTANDICKRASTLR